MSAALSTGLEKLQSTLDGSTEGAKIQQLAKDTKNVHDPKAKITTDFGMKVSNTDDWLKVATEDKTGYAL